MLTGIKRIIRSGFIGFWRNAFVSLSAIFVVTVTLTVVGAVMLTNELLGTSLTQIKNKVDINVYLVTTAEPSDAEALKDSLEALPDVAEVVYTTREQALTDFRERHKNDELTLQALDELGDNPLGASLAIKAKDPSQYESIAKFLEEQKEAENPERPIIYDVNFFKNKEAIDKLTSIVDAVERGSYIAMLVLIAASVLITFNTVRLAIYTSKEEISVMRLVGASNMFIRGPFVLQGIMYGLMSGVLTLLILYPIVLWLGEGTEAFFQFNIFNYYVTNFGHLFAVIVGSGVLLGMVSSTLAIARYLRV